MYYKLAQQTPSPSTLRALPGGLVALHEKVSKIPWKRYALWSILGTMGVPIVYRALTRPFASGSAGPDVGDLLRNYGRLILDVEAKYPYIDLLVGGLLGAGLGAAYSGLSGKEGISPILLGAALGSGVGYLFRK